MNFDWTSFLIGLILGWLLEWVIDWLYWRKGRVDADDMAALQERLESAEYRVAELESSLESKQAELGALQAKYDALEAEGVTVDAVRAELEQCRTYYADLEADYAQLRADIAALKNASDETRIRAIGRLTRLEGIDEQDAGRLYDAGIASSDDLLITDDDDVQAALGLDDDGYIAWSRPVKASLAGLGVALAASQIEEEEAAPVEEEEIALGVALAASQLEEEEEEFEGDLIIEEVLETFDFDEDGEVDLVIETTTEGIDLDQDGEIDIILEESIEADILDEEAVAAAEEEIEAEIDAELEALEEETDLAQARIVAAIDLAAEVAESTGIAEPEDLTMIQGIGPRFSEKLNAAGILTFAALAAASDEDLDAAIQPKLWQKVDYDSWRSQAGTFAVVPLPQITGDDLQSIEGIGPKYSELLRAADILTFAELADSEPEQLAEIIGAPAWRKVDYNSWIAQAGLAAAGDTEGLAQLQAELSEPQENNLTLIHGIGDHYVVALTDAGVVTFEDLARQTPEQLEAIVIAAGLRRANFEEWIEEAKLRSAGKRVARQKREYENAQIVSCPQDLESIEGIGVVYERRLYEAGIGSYWEVAQLSDARLSDILEVMPFQDVDLAAIRASAMALAVETGTVNRVWDGSEPDDFEPLAGIGVIYERRLYQAGYCTFEALAAATPEELEAVCQPPAGRKPDFAGWIATAQILATAKGANEG